MTRKISLPVQIASLLALALVSVLVVLLVANRLGVEDSFNRLLGIGDFFLLLLGILLSALIICVLVLYLRQHNKASTGGFFRRIIDRTTEFRCGPFRLKMVSDLDSSQRKPEAHIKSDKMILDPVSSQGKLDNNSGVLLADTATSSGSLDNFNEIEKKAWQGNAEAQFNLGVLYDKKQNHTKAAHWYQRAAEQGHAKARFNLGVSYYNGEGVKQNHTKAANFFRLAAEQGHAKAQFNLGALYYKGEGVAQNYTAAANWYRRAAKQGVAKAQFNLGASYHNGEGVAQNYSEAYIWFSLASAGNYPNAREARDQVAKKLDADSMKNAQSETARRAEKIRRKRESESQ